ncbi:NAD(P)-dependent oxidoreductase [Thalassobacillus pellis]|uniref:NAD(P)-dependent oxidoreductase n=1 Tax=Thalassobacillus pellis TaxID=748008 RepID=UPI00195FB742
MMKNYVYITRKLPDEVVEPLTNMFDVGMWDYAEKPVERDILLKEAARADALVTVLSDQVDYELLSKGSNLKVVANMAVGFDNVDINSAADLGIQVTNTPDVLTDTTADLTFALLMAAGRRMMEASEYIKQGKWKNWSPLFLAGTDIHHKSIGIVGMGRIGEAVARRARGFEMNILYHNRNRKPEVEQELDARYCSFNELLATADYVVCLAPYTKETEKLFNKEAFNGMKPSGIFINASRGQLVDEEALYQALVNKEIQAAGLDVFENEPISPDHPLLELEQVVCLPHIGSASKETRYKMMGLCIDNVIAVLQGKKAVTPVN